MRISAQSLEYVYVPVSLTDSAAEPIDPSTVEMSFPEKGKSPEEADWHDAVFEAGRVKLLVGPPGITLDVGDHSVYVRVNNSPELLVKRAGLLEVV